MPGFLLKHVPCMCLLAVFYEHMLGCLCYSHMQLHCKYKRLYSYMNILSQVKEYHVILKNTGLA